MGVRIFPVQGGVKADWQAAQKRESRDLTFDWFHLEAGQTKYALPSPPQGDFPKFLRQPLRVALKSLSSLYLHHRRRWWLLVKVVGGEWKIGLPGGSFHMYSRSKLGGPL